VARHEARWPRYLDSRNRGEKCRDLGSTPVAGLAHEIGIGLETVRRTRNSGDPYGSPDERTGRDGKSYSIRQRITDDPDISPELAAEAEATGRRRVFQRCAEDAVRKARVDLPKAKGK
jgi:hypothetical protein